MEPTYAEVALAVRKYIYDAVGDFGMHEMGIQSPGEIDSDLNLGLPAPLGMSPQTIMGMRPSLNGYIQHARLDKSANHPISMDELKKVKTVGKKPPATSVNLVDLVWKKIKEP